MSSIPAWQYRKRLWNTRLEELEGIEVRRVIGSKGSFEAFQAGALE